MFIYYNKSGTEKIDEITEFKNDYFFYFYFII